MRPTSKPFSGNARGDDPSAGKWRRKGLKRLNPRREMAWPRKPRTHKIWRQAPSPDASVDRVRRAGGAGEGPRKLRLDAFGRIMRRGGFWPGPSCAEDDRLRRGFLFALDCS